MYINVLNLVAGAVCIQDIVRESTFIIISYIILHYIFYYMSTAPALGAAFLAQ